MLTAKAIIEAAKGETDGYIALEMDQTRKQVEIEGCTGNMTLFAGFSRNQPSLWKMMARQADECFAFLDETEPTAIGQTCTERTYGHETDPKFGVILCNDHVSEEILVQITMPISERALDAFVQWTESPAGCCKFFHQALQLALAERSQTEHYRPGGLLGDYN